MEIRLTLAHRQSGALSFGFVDGEVGRLTGRARAGRAEEVKVFSVARPGLEGKERVANLRGANFFGDDPKGIARSGSSISLAMNNKRRDF